MVQASLMMIIIIAQATELSCPFHRVVLASATKYEFGKTFFKISKFPLKKTFHFVKKERFLAVDLAQTAIFLSWQRKSSSIGFFFRSNNEKID